MKLVRIKYYLINSVVFIFFLITCALSSKAQVINLVPDPSFEDTTATVNFSTQMSLKHWKNLDTNRLLACRSSYCSYNNLYPSYKLPTSYLFNQHSKSGQGVVGLAFQYNNLPADLKSITRTKLKSKMIAGKTYCVKIYAVFGERGTPYITDGLQLYFDNGGLDTMISIRNDSSSNYPQVVPQLSLNHVLTDTVNWNLVMGSFVANGTEEFLTLGNFKSDANTTKIVINPGSLNNPSADLLIDDVSVYPIDLANWLPDTYYCVTGDSALIGLPNYETPDAKWYTYNMQLIDSGSQIKVLPPASGTKYICGIDMCNTMVFDTVTVVGVPLAISKPQFQLWELRVYPNPARDVVNIIHALGDNMYLYNTVGTLVATEKIVQNKASINVRSLAKGVYVLRTRTQVTKLVVE